MREVYDLKPKQKNKKQKVSTSARGKLYSLESEKVRLRFILSSRWLKRVLKIYPIDHTFAMVACLAKMMILIW